jgi:hypothetical protein
MKEEYIKIRAILQQIFRHEQSLLRNEKLPEYHYLFDEYPPMNDENEIHYLMRDDHNLQSDFSESKTYFYLPPIDSQPKIIPILLMDCNLVASDSDISFIIILFQFLSKDKPAERIAFRFEGPHGFASDRSRHNYWHVQVTNEIASRHGVKNFKCRDWLPVRSPCIPIISKCPVSLLLCTLFSLYGLKMFEYIPAVENKYKDPLKDVFDNVR